MFDKMLSDVVNTFPMIVGIISTINGKAYVRLSVILFPIRFPKSPCGMH